MGDPWQDEGFGGGEDGWDEEKDSAEGEGELEDDLTDDLEDLDDESWEDDEGDGDE
jgi:hypothetical protein